jgi:hypothetical protein
MTSTASKEFPYAPLKAIGKTHDYITQLLINYNSSLQQRVYEVRDFNVKGGDGTRFTGHECSPG